MKERSSSRLINAIAFAVCFAIATYAATLVLQRRWHTIQSTLAWAVSPTVSVTYYGRVGVSLLVGALGAACGSRLSIAEDRLAIVLTATVCFGIAAAALFP